MVDVLLVGFSKIEFLVGPKKLLNFLSSFSRQQFSLAFRINFCTTKGFGSAKARKILKAYLVLVLVFLISFSEIKFFCASDVLLMLYFHQK